jgi:uncharacterized protein (DUF3084 family)
MSLKCEFCGTSFTKNSNLKTHQNKALYCLEIQYKGKKNKNDIRNELQYTCTYCNKKFPQKQGLQSHVKICKSKDIMKEFNTLEIKYLLLDQQLEQKDQQIEQKEQQIKKLETQLEQERKNQQFKHKIISFW